jgi:A/G-specific adenine glycosylase
MSIPASPALHDLIPELLAWVREARRDLPWRRRRDPYAVWISEIMLQQTQVATVVPYFERWVARFPDLASLAAAPLDDVLKAWEGLGYYARARNLHRAARVVVERHGGTIPSERSALLALPGIGRYTVGAILSLAFGQREPVLDGNVRRVLCRIYDIAEDPREKATEERLWTFAAALANAAPENTAGEVNEALMELGALICTPDRPQCDACPLHDHCLARAHGVEMDRPVKHPKARPPHYDVVAAVIRDQAGRYLLVRRPDKGLLGGLWGFPGGLLREDETIEGGLVRSVREQTSLEIAPGHPITRLKHAYTHFHITLHAHTCTVVTGEARPLACDAVSWVAADEFNRHAFPVTDAKIADLLRSGRSD